MTFDQQMRDSGTLYTQQDCGCLALVMYNTPSVTITAARDIEKQKSLGRELKTCKTGELPPLNCDKHEREYQERKRAQSPQGISVDWQPLPGESKPLVAKLTRKERGGAND